MSEKKTDLTSKQAVAKSREVYNRLPSITSKPGQVSKELNKTHKDGK